MSAQPTSSTRSAPAAASAPSSSDAFDLSLVAESMSYMNNSTAPSNSNSSGTPPSSTSPDTPPEGDEAEDGELEDSLANIDLSTLTPADRALLQPLLDLMAPGREGEEEGDLARRLDEAGEVASGLEGMLDGLLERLGGMLGEDTGEGAGEGDEEVEEQGKEEAEGGRSS